MLLLLPPYELYIVSLSAVNITLCPVFAIVPLICKAMHNVYKHQLMHKYLLFSLVSLKTKKRKLLVLKLDVNNFYAKTENSKNF